MAHFSSRTAPTWMQENRNKIVAALGAAAIVSIAITGFAGRELLDGESNSPAVTTHAPQYPESRLGVRGPVDADPSVRLGVNGPVERAGRGQVDADPTVGLDSAAPLTRREPTYPESRQGVRGPVDGDPSVRLGVTRDSVQPSAREPKYPASREGQRGHVDVE